jgi:hypothetical protein
VIGLAVLAVRMAQRSPESLLSPALGGPDVVELVRGAPEGAHLYAPFRSAGLVIWEGAPRGIRVLYDSRNDCYSPEVASFVSGTYKMTDAQILEGFDRFGVQMALVPTVDHVEHDSLDVVWKKLLPVARAPAMSAAWTVRTRSGGWVLYERAR